MMMSDWDVVKELAEARKEADQHGRRMVNDFGHPTTEGATRALASEVRALRLTLEAGQQQAQVRHEQLIEAMVTQDVPHSMRVQAKEQSAARSGGQS